MRPLPLEERKAKLAKLIRNSGIALCEHVEANGATVFEHACRMGLEGIVSKRKDAPYIAGKCKTWVKVKNPAAPAMLRLEDGTW